MEFFSCIFVPLVFALQCLGVLSGNILTGRSTEQSSTLSSYTSRQAIDGDTGTYSHTSWESNPYWECDLGGYFNVTKITVTSKWDQYVQGAIIETATSPMGTCPEMGSTFTCGRWPIVTLESHTIAFNCAADSVVRYVRIRREGTSSHLIIAEVEAEGVLGIPPDQQRYDQFPAKKVTTLVKSFSVALITECVEMCYRNQPCVAFSFGKSQRLNNCLLAANTSMVTDADWVSCQVNECAKLPTCPSNG